MARRAGGAFATDPKDSVVLRDVLSRTVTAGRGVSISGLEQGTQIAPSLGTIQYLAAQGVTKVRIPYDQKRVQPTAFGPLDATQSGLLVTVVNQVTALGMTPVVDNHSYAHLVMPDGVNHPLGDGTYTKAMLVDHTQKVAALFAANSLVEFGLMNEPYGLPDNWTLGSELIPNPTMDSNITGWTAGSNTTLAQSTTQYHSGTGSLAITATAAGNAQATSALIPVTPGQRYKAGLWAKAATTARQTFLQYLFFDSSYNVLGNVVQPTNTFVTDSTSAWTQTIITPNSIQGAAGVTAPAGAAYVEVFIVVNGAAANEVHYFDDVTFRAVTGGLSEQQVWEDAAQGCLTAIRGMGLFHLVYLSGYNYSPAGQFWINHPNWTVTDPLNRYAFEAHYYADGAGSGIKSYANTVAYAQAAGYVGSGVTDALYAKTRADITAFQDGCSSRGARGFLGEFAWFQNTGSITDGTPAPDELNRWANWGEYLMGLLDARNTSGCYWSAGDAFASFNYCYSPYLGQPNSSKAANAGPLEAHYNTVSRRSLGLENVANVSPENLPLSAATRSAFGNIKIPVYAADFGLSTANTAAQNDAALAAAIAQAQTQIGSCVMVSWGTYKYTTINAKATNTYGSGIGFQGAGRGATIFSSDTASSELLSVGGYNNHFADFTIMHSDSSLPTGIGDGLVSYKCAYSTFERIQITNAGRSISIAQQNVYEPGTTSGSANWFFSNSLDSINILRYKTNALFLNSYGGGSTGSHWRNIYIQNVNLAGTAQLVSTGNAVDLLNCDFTGDQINIEDLTGTSPFLANAQCSVNIQGLHMERVHVPAGYNYVRAYGGAQITVDSLSIAYSNMGISGSGNTTIASAAYYGQVRIGMVMLNTNPALTAGTYTYGEVDSGTTASLEVGYVSLNGGSPSPTANTKTAASNPCLVRINGTDYGLARGLVTRMPLTTTVNVTAAPSGGPVAGNYYLVNSTSAVTMTLPTSSAGQAIGIMNVSTTTPIPTVTISGTINGVANSGIVLVMFNEAKYLVADGSGGWTVLSSNYGRSALDSRYLRGMTTRTAQTASFTATPQTMYTVDATNGAVTVTLPTTNIASDLIYIIKSDTSTNLVTLSGTINGTASTSLPFRIQNQGKLLQGDGTGNWNIVAGDLSLASLDLRYALAGTTGSSYSTTSTTSNTCTTGSKTFTVGTGLAWTAGQYVLITNTGTPANNMTGTVTSYNSSTGAMVVSVTAAAGSTAAITAWTLNLTGAPGPVGAAPVVPLFQTVAYAATITPNAALGNVYCNLTGAMTVAAPSNPTVYQTLELILYNSSSSAQTVTFASGAGGFVFGTTAPSSGFGTLAAGTYTRVYAQYNSTQNLWVIQGYSQGSVA